MVEKILILFRSLNNINFEEPDKLQLLAVPLAFFVLTFISWLVWLYLRPKATHGSRYPLFGRFKLWFFLTVGLVFLIGALARPFVTEGNIIVKRGNAEVIFIVDYSSSMLLKDTGMARIDIVSRELMKLLSFEVLKEGDRAALFVLGKSGVRYLPLTSDLSSFAGEVSKLGLPTTLLGSNIYWGSDIGSTLEKVYTSMDRQDAFMEFKGKEAPRGWRPDIRQNRLVIFMGDGDYFNYNNDEDRSNFEDEDKRYFETGLNEFRKRGLKIYPVGIGTRTGGKMLDILRDYEKVKEYDLKLEQDLEGQESRLNTYYLDIMKSVTGAEELFLIENVDTDANNFLKTIIDNRRSTYIEPGMNQEKESLWLHFLLGAVGFSLLGWIITKF